MVTPRIFVTVQTGSQVSSGLAYSTQSNLLASAEFDGIVRLFDPRSDKSVVLQTLVSHKLPVASVSWSPSHVSYAFRHNILTHHEITLHCNVMTRMHRCLSQTNQRKHSFSAILAHISPCMRFCHIIPCVASAACVWFPGRT